MNIDLYLFAQFSKEDSKSVMPKDLLEHYQKAKSQALEINESQEYKHYKAGNGLLAYMRVMVAKEKNGQAEEQTQKLLTFFGNKNVHDILKYLKKYDVQHQNTPTPIHDACLFQLPIYQEDWESKLSIWRQLAKQKFHYEKWFMELLPLARGIEKHPKFNNQITREELLQITADLTYTQDMVRQDPKAAQLFMKYKQPKEIFQEYLELSFADDGSLPDIKLDVYLDSKNIVTIVSPSQDVEEFKKIYTIEKLFSKAEAALLGHFTGCCQHLGGQGRESTLYGITHPKSGFYVVRDQKGKIIAQTWAWQTTTGILVFDSIEFNNAVFGQKKPLLSELFRELAEQITYAPGTRIKEVRVGKGGQTPINCGIQLSTPRRHSVPPPPSYSGYTDSKEQRQLTLSLADLCKKLKLKEDSSEKEAYQAEIRTVVQWVAFFYYFKIDAGHQKWFDLINKLPGMVKTADDFIEVLTILPQDQHHAFYQSFKNKLSSIIKTVDNYKDVLKCLSSDQRPAFYQDLNNQSPRIIETTDDFIKVLVVLPRDQRPIFCQNFKNKLPSIIKTADNYSDVLKYLSLDQRPAFYQDFKDKLPSMIKTANDFKNVLMYLPDNQIPAFYQDFKGRAPSLIETAFDLNMVLICLPQKEGTMILKSIEENFCQLRSLIENEDCKLDRIDEMRAIFKESKDTRALTKKSVEEKLDLYNRIKEIVNNQFSCNNSIPGLIKFIISIPAAISQDYVYKRRMLLEKINQYCSTIGSLWISFFNPGTSKKQHYQIKLSHQYARIFADLLQKSLLFHRNSYYINSVSDAILKFKIKEICEKVLTFDGLDQNFEPIFQELLAHFDLPTLQKMLSAEMEKEYKSWPH